MSGERWMKFYTSDWLGDAQLRTCSVAARGLWMDMICLMDNASPRGHLKLGRRKLDMPTLAGLVGLTPKQLEKLIDELREADVFSLTNRGVIFSRKMIREEKWRKNGAKAVKSRWAKATENKEEIGKRIRGSMTPESRVQNQTSLPFRLDATRDLPSKSRPLTKHHDPPDYSNDPVEPTQALLRTPIVKLSIGKGEKS
jgi:hypothetical protein